MREGKRRRQRKKLSDAFQTACNPTERFSFQRSCLDLFSIHHQIASPVPKPISTVEFPGQRNNLKVKVSMEHPGSVITWRRCMAKRFIYLANDILPHCGLSPLQSAARVLWLAAEKGFSSKKKSAGSEDVNLNSDCADSHCTDYRKQLFVDQYQKLSVTRLILGVGPIATYRQCGQRPLCFS